MPNKELRAFKFEIRAEMDEENRGVITGTPIVFDQVTDLGFCDERIAKGALDKTDLTDVRLLVNHDTSGIPLARSRNNTPNSTMQFTVEEDGMHIRARLDIDNNPRAKELYSAIQRGDVSGMSFMFTVDGEQWDDLMKEHPTRTITSIERVFEVSAVTFPAYEGTDIHAADSDLALESARAALESAREEARAAEQTETETASDDTEEAEERKAEAEQETAEKAPVFERCAVPFKDMDSSELTERAAQIETIACAEAEEERAAIMAELESRRAAAREAEEIRKKAAEQPDKIITEIKERKKMEFNASSTEYRSGFLKTMLNMELSNEERDAVSYVATTTDSTYHASYAIPTQMLNEIWDLVEKNNPILGDIDLKRTGTEISVLVRSAISQGDAATVSEAAANDDEVNTWATVVLSGKDFSKHFDMSYAMAKMSIEAFEDYIKTEIADRIGEAIGKDVVTQILADYDDTYNAVETATAGEVAFRDVAATMATLGNAKGGVCVYGSHATVYEQLVGMVDDNGRPVFQYNAQEGAAGTLIGAPVKIQSGIDDGVLLIGYPKQVIGNMVQDIMLESARDIKKHVITYAGYARFECKLVAPDAFATLTLSEAEEVDR